MADKFRTYSEAVVSWFVATSSTTKVKALKEVVVAVVISVSQ